MSLFVCMLALSLWASINDKRQATARDQIRNGRSEAGDDDASGGGSARLTPSNPISPPQPLTLGCR